MPRVQQVIISDDERRGDGTDNDPVRIITSVHDFDGKLIAQYDPWTGCGYSSPGMPPVASSFQSCGVGGCCMKRGHKGIHLTP